jgi:hypothetical protein
LSIVSAVRLVSIVVCHTPVPVVTDVGKPAWMIWFTFVLMICSVDTM